MARVFKNRIIPPLFLCGDSELAAAIGIKSTEALADLRKDGLPYYYRGKSFLYDPDEVKKWIKAHCQVQKVKIKAL